MENSSVTGESPYGLCVYRHQMGWDSWYGHQGRWKGMLTDLFFEPETGNVVVLIANGVQKKLDQKIDYLAEQTLEFIAPWTYFIVD